MASTRRRQYASTKKETVSMENRNLKDAKRREAFYHVEQKRILYKALLKDRGLSHRIRFEMCLKLNALPRASARVKIQNRCVLTGRAKAVLRKFKISRICMRELVAYGALPGVTKSSW
jgi:ribosomal protein S14